MERLGHETPASHLDLVAACRQPPRRRCDAGGRRLERSLMSAFLLSRASSEGRQQSRRRTNKGMQVNGSENNRTGPMENSVYWLCNWAI